MLTTVDVGRRSLSSYRGIAPDELLDKLTDSARDLQGARVLHVNATPYGGGVSELLRSLVPLANDLGLVAEWKVISAENDFFSVTKTIHNALQGAERGLDKAERDAYLAASAHNAELLEEDFDVVFVHDPQPAGILPFHGKGDARWVWRCHIDTSQPNPKVWDFLSRQLTDYDAAIFTMEQFVPPDFPVDRVEIIPPAIDPASPKNLPLPPATAQQVLDWIGVCPDRPLVTQIARFDPWKDPLGVIAAYRLAREAVPGLELALAGSMALDDPEGWDVYREIREESEADPLIHVFSNLNGVGNIEVNVFQRLSQVVVQKSVREGFGLVVSEALWKGTPVVAGRAGGIPLQMADGVGGFLVDDVEECARAIVRLLEDPDKAAEVAARGKQRVREHFLLPRLLLNELSLIGDLVRERPPRCDLAAPGVHRDPVCGMTLTDVSSAPHASHDGPTYYFCSEACRLRFVEEPEHYLATCY